MDTSSTLGIIAFGLQFCILGTLFTALKWKVERIEKAKCRCCDQGHPLLDPCDP